MRTRIALTVGIVALALVAAGCGGSDNESTSQTTSADDWAAGFCSAVTDWTDELKNITSEFSSPSNLSQDGLQNAAEDVRGATDNLVDDLRGLGAPDTESGQEVKTSLDSLSNTLEAESGKISDIVDGVSGVTGIPGALSSITTSLSAMGTAFSNTLQTIEDADAKGELQGALEDSPDCAGITS
jgi:uncharacterized phage infection (PIP) family protein YhgE